MAAAPDEAEERRLIFSVWARPPADVGDRVKKLMEDLRTEFGGPEFEPHVTVVGAIALTEKDALEKLRSACRALKPYTIRIYSVSRGPSFFQCVYLLVDTSPEVMESCMHASHHFGYERTSPYMPHMSLLYGDFTDEEKEKVVERAKSFNPEICNLSFEVSCLTLYESDTDDLTLKSWRKVADIELSGNDQMQRGSFKKRTMSLTQQVFHTRTVVPASGSSRLPTRLKNQNRYPSSGIKRSAEMNWKPQRNGGKQVFAPGFKFLHARNMLSL